MATKSVDDNDDKAIIMCIDDDAVVRKHLTNQITRRFGDQFEIIVEDSSLQALEVIRRLKREHRYLALVITDMMMPGLQGDELLSEIHTLFPHAIKILLTGVEGVEESIINAINHADLYRYIPKPWEEEDLFLTVENALEKFRLVTRLQRRIDAQTHELYRKHEELQQKHQQLKEAQTRLVQSEKIAALGILLAGVAHEIKNPAQFAHVGAFNLQRRLEQLHDFLVMMAGDDPDPELIELLDEKFSPLFQNMDAILDGTNRIQLLAGNLHAFSRLSDNDNQVPVHLSEGLRSTLALVEANFRERVAFSVDIAFDPLIVASSAKMNQVFMNVIVNACQAITARQAEQKNREQGTLYIRMYEADDNTLGIFFEDSGVGIPAENQSAIFEPFFTTKPKGEGTGLGLSITANIIKEHNGLIEIASTVGEGTRFTLLLPLSHEEASEAPAESKAEDGESG